MTDRTALLIAHFEREIAYHASTKDGETWNVNYKFVALSKRKTDLSGSFLNAWGVLCMAQMDVRAPTGLTSQTATCSTRLNGLVDA